jgi:FkbM family methyltransferase
VVKFKEIAKNFAIGIRGIICKSRVSNYYFLKINKKNLSKHPQFDLLPENFKAHILSNLGISRSQYGQDLFVLYMYRYHFAGELPGGTNGYFVEFGATDGVNLSNSLMLEKEFGWNGILAEPARNWKKHLNRNRKSILENACVYSASGLALRFFEAEIGSLSTIEGFQELDFHSRTLSSADYLVESISLEDLLNKHVAPSFVHYLSIDTEGSEYEILKEFNFGSRNIGIITVEHNFTDARENIYKLLNNNGFDRILPEFSQCDDWYVNREFFQKITK